MKNIFALFLFMFLVACSFPVLAYDPLVFDSTNNYIGACQLTDNSEWTLSEDLNVSTFQIWYNWDANETSLPVTLYKDGQEFASFTATRTGCDTYQKNWCNADYELNKIMPAGTYTTKIPTAKQCLEPGKTGTVRLYGTNDASKNDTDITRTSPDHDNTQTKTRSSFARYWYIYLGGAFVLGMGIYASIRKKS